MPPSDPLTFAAQYGLSAVTVFSCGWFITYILKQHREERKEMRDVIQSQHVEATQAINNNTIVLSELRTIISTRS